MLTKIHYITAVIVTTIMLPVGTVFAAQMDVTKTSYNLPNISRINSLRLKPRSGMAAVPGLIMCPGGYDNPLGSGPPPSVSTGFEPAEGFVPGHIDGQVGWFSFMSSNSEAHIDTVNPNTGTQHLRISHDPDLGFGEFVGAFTPDLGPLPTGSSTVSVDVSISATNGADYFVVPQSPSQGLVLTWVDFAFTDDILVVDDVGFGSEWVDTGVDWTLGTYGNLKIVSDPLAGKIDYYFNDILIYTGIMWAGTNVEQVVLLSDNANDMDDGDFDNLSFGPSGATVNLNTDMECYNATDTTITVTIDLTGAENLIVGGQFFLEYDNSILDFISADPGNTPFTIQVYESVDEGTGTIDYAVGVPNGDSGTSDDTIMAVLTFGILAPFCEPTVDLVSFREHTPPTRLTRTLGIEVAPGLINLNAIKVDQTPPIFDSFPSDITDINADAGGCTRTLTIGEIGSPTASDNCGGSVLIEWLRDDFASNLDDPFAAGTTTITWKITDTCGNYTTQDQYVSVNAFNTLEVDVELQSTVIMTPFDRCIRFELFESGCGSSTVINEVLTFTNGKASATLDVPCGSYECITAQDELHTLRRTDDDGDFVIVPGSVGIPKYYISDFTTSGTTDDCLIGGNFLNDDFIDILDFGAFIGQWAINYGSGNTDCDTSFPHADANGDGLVWTADYTFIAANFLKTHEDNCCGLGPQWDNGIFPTFIAGPVVSITVAELERRGLGDLVVADLNNDGILNLRDIRAFLNGDRP